MIKYSYTISGICNLGQKLTYICFGHMNLFFKYSMNIHHLQKMLVINLVLATKCYSVMNNSPKIIGYTIATRYDAEYVVIEAIIPFVARSGCFYEE